MNIQSNFKIERRANESDARVMRRRRAEIARHQEGVIFMGKSATRLKGTTVVHQRTVVPTNGEEAARQLSAIIIPLETGDVAQAAQRTKDAVKKWKEGRSMPGSWSLLMMARDIPVVHDWVQAIICGNDFVERHLRAVAQAALYQAVHDKGPGGDAFREEISRIARRAEGR